MRRAALIVLLSSCLLDPVGVLNHSALEVEAFDLPQAGSLHLTTVDAAAETRVKRAPIFESPMHVFYEAGSLALGPVDISAEVFDATNTLVGCGTARGIVGETELVVIGFASPSTSAVNCGTCGNRCETDVATGTCVGGRCSNWECAPGLTPQADGGCTEPEPPDAGMNPDGGTDGGMIMMCMPAAEDSVTACSNGLDDNCDLRTDCTDPGCQNLTQPCDAGCMAAGVQAWDCGSRTWGACVGDPGAENTVAACSDGMDNDCDGKPDCLDDGCTNIKVPCPGGICAAGLKLWNCSTHLFGLCLPYIPLAENSGLLCGNALDDDCDGKTDCIDLSCRGQSCGSGKICCADGGCAGACP